MEHNERDIEADKRMAAFLVSRNYKGETWMTDEMLYYKWLEQGALIAPIHIKGFSNGTPQGLEEGEV